MTGRVALLALWTLFGATALGAQPVDRDQASREASAASVHIAAAKLHRLARAGDTAGLAAELLAIQDNTRLTTAARARLLHDAILALSAKSPDAPSRQVVERLTTTPVAVWVWHTEGHRQSAVPMFDVGAAARHTVRQWKRMAMRDATLDRARAGAPLAQAPTDIDKQNDALLPLGVADALQDLPVATLGKYRSELSALVARDPVWTAAVAVAARRLGDAALYEAMLRHGSAGDVVRALGDIAGALDSALALEALRTAADRPAIASAALFEIGRMAGSDPAASELLFEWLGDRERGGSAAAALARVDDPGVVVALGKLLGASGDALTQSRAALSLWLNGGAAANAALLRFSRDDNAPPALRRQVAAWVSR